MDKNPLIGKTITAFEMTNDRKAMRFVVADGEPFCYMLSQLMLDAQRA